MRDRSQLVLPMELGVKIAENDPVRKLVEICEELDYSKLYARYVRKWRKVSPETLFELVVFGYMQRRFSTRQIEEACRTDIRFMWILQGEPVPDHSTIDRFLDKRLADVIEDLFYQLVERLSVLGEVRFRNMFVDGTKVEAYANRYTFVWKKAVEKNLKKLEAKIAVQLPVIAQRYGMDSWVSAEDACESLVSYARMLGIEFVHGSGKRKTQLQKDIELLSGFLAKKAEYLGHLGKMKGRNSYSKTDTDATFMRMKDDYMRNGQLKPGYNIQIGVADEYIAVMDVQQYRSDMDCFVPLIEKFHRYYGIYPRYPVADAGYGSYNNYLYCQEHGMEKYMKFPMYKKEATDLKYREDPYRAENFRIDDDGNMICPNGKKMMFSHRENIKGNQYGRQNEVYRCEDCSGCLHADRCKKTDNNRTIIFKFHQTLMTTII